MTSLVSLLFSIIPKILIFLLLVYSRELAVLYVQRTLLRRIKIKNLFYCIIATQNATVLAILGSYRTRPSVAPIIDSIIGIRLILATTVAN